MADNRKRYGFRWSVSANGKGCPQGIEYSIADNYQGQSDGAAANVGLSVGDPVKLAATGGVALANTTEVVFGIVVAICQYWDANQGFMVQGDYVPGAINYGGNLDKQTRVLVVPANWGLWEVDANAATASDEATWRSYVHENVEHVCAGDTTVSGKPKADPMIASAGHAATATLGWRIMGVSKNLENKDFSGLYVKLIVAVNESSYPAMPASASIVGGL